MKLFLIHASFIISEFGYIILKIKGMSFVDAAKKLFHLAQFSNDLNSFFIFGAIWQLYSFSYKNIFLRFWF